MQRGVGAVWVRGAYLWHAVALSLGDPGTTAFVPGYGQVHPLRGAAIAWWGRRGFFKFVIFL